MLRDDNFGVVVISCDCNPATIRYTSKCLKGDFPKVPYIVMVGENEDASELNFCPVHKGGKTVTSLIDVGVRLLKTEWCLVMMAGGRLRNGIFYRKYCYFVKSDRDILYPVVDRKYLFHEASINGILLHKNFLKEVGEFGNDPNIQKAKLFWADRALKAKYKLKALVGVNLL